MPYPSKLLHHHQRNRRPHYQWRVIQLTLSSYSACIHSIRPNFIIYCTPPNIIHSIGENFWNEVSVEEAYRKGPLQSVHVYVTAKVASKKVAWKYV